MRASRSGTPRLYDYVPVCIYWYILYVLVRAGIYVPVCIYWYILYVLVRAGIYVLVPAGIYVLVRAGIYVNGKWSSFI